MSRDPFENFNDDPLGDTSKFSGTLGVTNPQGSAKPAKSFIETCPKCRGSGRFGRFGECFKCKGKGSQEFTTSPEARAKGRANAAIRQAEVVAARAEASVEWHQMHTAESEFLHRMAAWHQRKGHADEQNFEKKMLDAVTQWGSLTPPQLAAVHKGMLRDTERQAQWAAKRTAVTVDASKIEQAFATARQRATRPGMVGVWMRPIQLQSGAKAAELVEPELRSQWLRENGRRITFQAGTAKWDGFIFVQEGDQKLGHITGGQFKPKFECTDAQKAAVLDVCSNPAQAALAHGKAWSLCSVCGRTLTNDDSIARGIGPICAENFGF